MTKNAWMVGLLALALAACGDDGGGGTDSGLPDSGGQQDAGGGVDAGGGGDDAGPADAGGGGDDAGGGGDDAGGGVPTEIAPCGPTDWVTDTTTITFSGFQYSPQCVQVTAGTSVTIPASATHPLAASTRGTTPSPITSTTSDATIAFATPGVYPFYCTNHGTDVGGGMAGAVRVVP